MREMFLLGAGASIEAGVPGAYDMTRKIVDQFTADRYYKKHAHLLSFVVGGLLFQSGIDGQNPLSAGVNVEDLFNAVQSLAKRNALEMAPFIGSWHPLIESFDKIQPASPRVDRLHKTIYESITKEIANALPNSPPSFSGDNVDKNLQTVIAKTVEALLKNRRPSISSSDSLSKAVGEYVLKISKDWSDKIKNRRPNIHEFEREFEKSTKNEVKPGGGRIFEEVAERMIRMLATIVWISAQENVHYLKPLIKKAENGMNITIATLNYDNSIELLAESCSVKCDTAIDTWSETGEFTSTQGGILLLKLHGSIDWKFQNGKGEDKPIPHQVIEKVPPDKIQEAGFRPAVIFGQKNKLTADGPFLDILRAFKLELTRATRLIIIGYSFRDVHINIYLSQWLNSNIDNHIVIIDPAVDVNNEFIHTLSRHASDRFTVIRKKASEGLIELMTQAALPIHNSDDSEMSNQTKTAA